jgi:RNase H-fold protein (predicted Holliday junction resolvase)
MKPTVLALDLGTSQTGYAFRGPSSLIEDSGKISTQQDLYVRIQRLLEKYTPQVLVVGRPEHGPINILADKVAEKFAPQYKVFVVNEDKTTKQAQFQLLKMHKPKARHEKIHGHSAANILEEYELIYEI